MRGGWYESYTGKEDGAFHDWHKNSVKNNLLWIDKIIFLTIISI